MANNEIIKRKNSPAILDDGHIGKLLWKLSLPATVGMLVMSMYNVVDTIFIGRGVGTVGIAAVAVAFPIQMIVGAIGQMIGMGGASLLSRSLGEGNAVKANKTLGNAIASVSVFSLAITLLGYLNLESLLKLFGATDSLLPHAREYMVYILAGVLLHGMGMALNNLVRAEGRAGIAMITMILSAVTNIILDAVFILGLNMGIRGAALATLIAYAAGAFFLLTFYLSGRSALRLRLRDIRFEAIIQREILAIGVSSFFRQTAMSLLVIIMNHTLASYGGDLAIAVYGVVLKLIMLIFTPILGISQGMQPVAGFNFGARRFAETRKSLDLAIFASTMVAAAGTIFLLAIPETLLSLFSSDPDLLAMGRDALRFVVLAFPFVGFQVMGTTLFQAMGKARQTFLLSLSRQILFLIPLVLILPRFFRLTGVWISFPIADLFSALLTLWMLSRLPAPLRTRMKSTMED